MLRVCDPCHSRKVRCDRNDPCGNCLDQNATCTRTRGMKRLPKRDLARIQRRAVAAAGRGQIHHNHPHHPSDWSQTLAQAMEPLSDDGSNLGNLNLFPQDDGFLMDMLGGEDGPLMFLERFEMGYELMSSVPLTDAQMINRRHLEHSRGLTWNRRQALESALSVASQILGSMEDCSEMAGEAAAAAAAVEGSVPSVEFLYWMLRDIGSEKFGAFISDYFRHVGKETLKKMGLSILYNTATPPDSILYTVCVNSVAFKFLNATLGTETDNELASRLQHSALLYRETAKAALKKIPLTIKPSLALLQALLCGTFLHQGSGDTNTCRALAKTACRVCMDIGLHPAATDLPNVTEEEYYCFMWCYILDRNYAWKFGSPRVLIVDPETPIHPSPSNTTISQLLLIYLNLAKVQDTMIPFLDNPINTTSPSLSLSPSLHTVYKTLLREMDSIRSHIDQIKPPSPTWRALDTSSEIASLDFAYHSILTNLHHLHQISLGHPSPLISSPESESYLDAARGGLRALLTLCASSDRLKTVAYLHWTLLYYPTTTYFAIFCNAIATHHSGDFHMLSAVSECLAQSGALSAPVAAMQGLLKEFVALSSGFFISGGGGGHVDVGDVLGGVSSFIEQGGGGGNVDSRQGVIDVGGSSGGVWGGDGHVGL
ncbi:hypothetical protein BDW59DRAFT_156841 [Aspergillus cavernicola]|uniref:Zn(2)-C6 fungal-type domain-containing protein n=1 Tax=Aspergillus cavernicola TaxID=176166 RepID=A0ABR4J034_9EURO